jgi:hypothetical protein
VAETDPASPTASAIRTTAAPRRRPVEQGTAWRLSRAA